VAERIRCAIYTRKSSEEGLEQSFNSLDAQREACESYIRSQKHEGWQTLKTQYDDGGLSGGSMDRPSLKRLLEDIDAGKIDTVVVYKIDRLTRSLLDFSKIVEAFDQKSVTFVSVTQQFNTTTSMGRLTLNILLSFAQFESEVTGERIRDKIAASKRKGMWMGGFVPLGYKLRDRQLLIDSKSAKIVREIFRQYSRLGCVSKLRAYLEGSRVTGKEGRPFSRGALYHILNNRIYLGEIVHRKQVYPGQHQPIVDAELWNSVSEKLKANNPLPERPPRLTESSILRGLVFDGAGVRYTPTHAVKKGKRYRYYTSQSVIQGRDAAGIPRIPAAELEHVVENRILALLNSPEELAEVLGLKRAERLKLPVCRSVIKTVENDVDERRSLLKSVLRRVVVLSGAVEIEISSGALKHCLFQEKQEQPSGRSTTLNCEIAVRTCGSETRIICESAPSDSSHPPAFLQALMRAHGWYARVVSGEVATYEELAEEAGMTSRYIRRIFRCATLAPDIVESCANGTNVHVNIERLRRRFPLSWREQRVMCRDECQRTTHSGEGRFCGQASSGRSRQN
jgi:site-specific DNA recombinase